MALDRKTRRRNLEKTWQEVAKVTNKVNDNIKIIHINNLIAHDFRTTKRVTIIKDFLIDRGSFDRYMFITEFPGMSERSVAHATPLCIVTGTDEINLMTAEGDLSQPRSSFFYTWEQIDKLDSDGQKTGKSTMFFKCWINFGHNSFSPFKLKLQIIFHNRNHYNEIQVNKQ